MIIYCLTFTDFMKCKMYCLIQRNGQYMGEKDTPHFAMIQEIQECT